MSAAEVKTLPTATGTDTKQEEPIILPVEELGFYRTRVHLLNAPRGAPVNQSHLQDRTVLLVSKFLTLKGELAVARKETMSCLEAIEGKNGAVTLKVLERETFNGLQDLIKDHMQQITAVEGAIRRLDSLGYGWYGCLSDEAAGLSHLEEEINARMSKTATWVLKMEGRSGLSPQDILSNNPEYSARKAEADKDLAAGKARLAKVKPALAEFDRILSSCGC